MLVHAEEVPPGDGGDGTLRILRPQLVDVSVRALAERFADHGPCWRGEDEDAGAGEILADAAKDSMPEAREDEVEDE